MLSSNQTQKLTLLNLEELVQDPNHQLSAERRRAIYESFSPSRPFDFLSSLGEKEVLEKEFLASTKGDYIFYWLAYLSAKKVLFVWDSFRDEAVRTGCTTPDQILTVMDDLLNQKISFKAAYNMQQEFNTDIHIENEVTYDLTCAYCAANWALESVLQGVRVTRNVRVKDDELPHVLDFASYAVKAYSAIDENPPGQVALYYGIDTNIEEREKLFLRFPGYIPVKFDVSKRFEFWQWWLSSAINEAFKLSE